MKKITFLVVTLTALMSACNKEKVQPELSNVVPVTYKINPSTIGELKGLAVSMNNGQAFRISEESYSEEEFWLYTEAVVNSLLTELEYQPDNTAERELSYNPKFTTFTTSDLLEAISEITTAITNDLATVEFDIDGNPYVHIVDVQWQSGSGNITVLYIAGVTGGVSPPINATWQMTMATNSTCDFFALNGEMQRRMLAYWNFQPLPSGKYRPNYLYSPPVWNQGYIPCCYTYTEVETRKVDFANPAHRTFYNTLPFSGLWHVSVFNNPTAAPPCLPYNWQGVPRTLQGYADGTAHLAIQLNPNPYSFPNNQNGLVLVGFQINPQGSFSNELDDFSYTNNNQKEYWHSLTYVYGRQIPTNNANQ